MKDKNYPFINTFYKNLLFKFIFDFLRVSHIEFFYQKHQI